METEVKVLFWVGTAVMFFLALGVLFFVVLYRNKLHKIKRRESEQLLKVSIESEKRERKRIAMDLHDGISGDLSAIQNYIAILHRKEKDHSKIVIFQEVEEALAHTLQNIQTISYNLMPPMLEEQGLINNLKNYFARVRKWNAMQITERYNTGVLAIPLADFYEVYRTIQELVTNSIKHGEATSIEFSMQQEDQIIILEIFDNGKSFDFYKSLKDSHGIGLKSIASRLKYRQAKLVQLSVEKGNKIQIHLKIKK